MKPTEQVETSIGTNGDLPCGATQSLQRRANLYRNIDETETPHEPIMVSGKPTSAVLLSAENWSAIQETLHLLEVPGMRESVKAGMAEPSEQSAKALKW